LVPDVAWLNIWTVIRRFAGTVGAWAIILGCSTVTVLSVIGVRPPWPTLVGSMVVIRCSNPWRAILHR